MLKYINDQGPTNCPSSLALTVRRTCLSARTAHSTDTSETLMTHKTPPTAASSRLSLRAAIPAACLVVLLSACGGDDSAPAVLPQLAAAQRGTLANCASLTGFAFANTTITSATSMAANAVTSNADGVTLDAAGPLRRGRQDEPAHRHRRQELRDQLRDASAHQLERPLLPPGERRQRRLHQHRHDPGLRPQARRQPDEQRLDRWLRGADLRRRSRAGHGVLPERSGHRAWASPARCSDSTRRRARTMAMPRWAR